MNEQKSVKRDYCEFIQAPQQIRPPRKNMLAEGCKDNLLSDASLKNMKKNTPIVIVVGLGKEDRALGYKNNLLWHVPDDLKRFKELTMGHPVIMGQKTFLSIVDILGKPFPGRTNIVVTFDKEFTYEGVKVAHSLEEAVTMAEAENPTEIHIGGGGEIYRQMLPYVDKLHVTWFHDQKEADTFFPEFADDFEVAKEYPVRHHQGLDYQWVDYVRKL